MLYVTLGCRTGRALAYNKVMVSCADLRCQLVLAVLSASWLNGQQLPAKTYTTADGLARNSIYCVVADPRGFLWFCAADELSRFDGYSFSNYGAGQALPNRAVSALQPTRGGVYWIGTGIGLFRLDSRTPSQVLQPVAVAPDERARSVTALLEDDKGILWVGTHDGVYRLADPAHDIFEPVHVAMTPNQSGERVVDTLIEDAGGALWIGSFSTLYRYAPDGLTAVFHDPCFASGILSLYRDREGRLWAGGDAGLCRLDPAATEGRPLVTRVYTPRDGLPGKRVEAILETSDGHLWAGTSNGLAELNPANDRFDGYTRSQGLTDPAVKCLAEDAERNLWVGTEGGGAIKIARRGFTSYTEADGLGSRRVASVFVNRAGDLCAVTNPDWKWSIDCYNGRRFSPALPKYPPDVHYFGWSWNQSAFQDHTGEWWLPTGQGLCRFATARPAQLTHRFPRSVFTTRDGLPGNEIFRLFEDSRGDIWVSLIDSPKNTARWERSTASFHVYSSADGLPDPPQAPTAFAEDRFGQIWAGFYAGGIARFSDGRFRRFTEADGAPAGMIRALHFDQAGRLWIASNHGGLARLDNPSEARPHFTVYTTAQGLSNNSVLCLTEDQWGRIYACTGRGVDRIDPRTGRVRHYTTADGLTPGELNTATRDRQGALWFGSLLGLSRLIPEPEGPTSPPPVLITGFQVRGVARPVGEFAPARLSNFVLKPEQNQVRIDFVALGFAPGESLRYQYRLEGADRRWSPFSEQRNVNYAALKPGSYTFRVRAVNAEGAISQDPAAVAFQILAPVWQRWWFLSAAGLLLAGAGYWLYCYRLEQLLAVERMRGQIATDLHDDIGSSLSQIALLSEVARRHIAGADPQMSTSLSEIAAVAGELVDAMSDIVWAINPQHDRLGDLIHRMRRFASDMLVARDIDLDFLGPAAEEDLRTKVNVRRHVFLIFKEGVTNIARHSACTRAQVEVKVWKEMLLMRLTDNGRGFDSDSAADGNGLANIRKRAGMMGGAVELETAPRRGTTLRLSVPLTYQNWWGRRHCK